MPAWPMPPCMHEGASVEGRNDCVCFGGQCPRSSCEWRENGRDGWVKFVSQVRCCCPVRV